MRVRVDQPRVAPSRRRRRAAARRRQGRRRSRRSARRARARRRPRAARPCHRAGAGCGSAHASPSRSRSALRLTRHPANHRVSHTVSQAIASRDCSDGNGERSRSEDSSLAAPYPGRGRRGGRDRPQRGRPWRGWCRYGSRGAHLNSVHGRAASPWMTAFSTRCRKRSWLHGREPTRGRRRRRRRNDCASSSILTHSSGGLREAPDCRSVSAGRSLTHRTRKLVSAASAWEITTKHRLGRLPGADEFASDIPWAIADEGFEELSITVDDAARAGALPGPLSDPFDRMLIAQALSRKPYCRVDRLALRYVRRPPPLVIRSVLAATGLRGRDHARQCRDRSGARGTDQRPEGAARERIRT